MPVTAPSIRVAIVEDQPRVAESLTTLIDRAPGLRVIATYPNGETAVTPPAWLKAAAGFEITPEGVRDVSWKSEAGQLVLDLGQTEVARLVLLTTDKELRGQLEELHRSRFAANVAQLTASGGK